MRVFRAIAAAFVVASVAVAGSSDPVGPSTSDPLAGRRWHLAERESGHRWLAERDGLGHRWIALESGRGMRWGGAETGRRSL